MQLHGAVPSPHLLYEQHSFIDRMTTFHPTFSWGIRALKRVEGPSAKSDMYTRFLAGFLAFPAALAFCKRASFAHVMTARRAGLIFALRS